MKPFERCVEPLVAVAHEPAESSSPGEASLDHPTARQQNEAAFRAIGCLTASVDAVALGGPMEQCVQV